MILEMLSEAHEPLSGRQQQLEKWQCKAKQRWKRKDGELYVKTLPKGEVSTYKKKCVEVGGMVELS